MTRLEIESPRDNPLPGKRWAPHDPFWPSIDLDSLRQRLHLAAEISEVQLLLAVQTSCATVARDLAGWRHSLRARGFHRLIDLSRHADGQALSNCYLRLIEAGIQPALDTQVKQLSLRPVVHKGGHCDD
ncbi:TPA: head completion/stabilization protein [Pseudomonas putida]|nr:head completion/stabilization protein [Pseudomonas putida]